MSSQPARAANAASIDASAVQAASKLVDAAFLDESKVSTFSCVSWFIFSWILELLAVMAETGFVEIPLYFIVEHFFTVQAILCSMKRLRRASQRGTFQGSKRTGT